MDFNEVPFFEYYVLQKYVKYVSVLLLSLLYMIYSTCLVLDFGSFTLWHALLYTLTLEVLISKSCGRQTVVRQLLGSHQALLRQSSGSRQAVVRQSSGSCQAVIRQ